MTRQKMKYRVLIEYQDESIHPIYISAKSKEEAGKSVRRKFNYTPIEVLKVEKLR